MTTEPLESSLPDEADELLDDGDLALLALVRQAYEAVDPVPEHLRTKIEFGLTLAAMFDEVDHLQQVQSTFSGARAAEQITTITFSGSDVSVMLTINDTAEGHVRVDGWVAPGTGWDVDLCIPGGRDPLTTRTDANGRFVFAQVPAQVAQFTLHRSAEGTERAFSTPLIQL